MRIIPRKDTFEITDNELQQILKAHVFQQTGRGVEGSIYINVTTLRTLGDAREESYTAIGNLTEEAK